MSSEELLKSGPGPGLDLTPLLWVEVMDCSLVEEQVLMRSTSLLWLELRWKDGVPPLPLPNESPPPLVSLGKESEAGLLAGEGGRGGTTAQKGFPLCDGLDGVHGSFPPPGA